MKFFRSYLLASFLTFSLFAETTPCSKHPGLPLNNEGTGICTGNSSVKITLPTAGFSFLYNSQALDTGYGTGWSVVPDSAFVKTSASAATLYLSDATPIALTLSAGKWIATKRAYYDDTLVDVNATTVRQTNVDGTVLNYTKVGTTNRYALSSITSRKGTELTITRNASGLITQMTNFFGESIVVSYDTLGKPSSLRDLGGNFYNFTYVGPNLTRISYPDGLAENFTYNTANQLTSHTDRKNRTTSYTYTGTGASAVIASVTNYEGLLTTFTYGTDTVTADGFDIDLTEVFTPNTSGGITITAIRNGTTTKKVYDGSARLVQETNHFGSITNYLYNSTNPFPKEVQYGDGTRLTLSYASNKTITQEKVISPTASLTIDYTRDSFGSVTKKTVTGPTGIKSIESYTYDTKGNLTKIVDSASKTAFTAVYNAQSLVTSQTNLQGYTTTNSYDAFGNATSGNYATGETETRSYNALGAILSWLRMPQNASHQYDYDFIGRPLLMSRRVSAAGGSLGSVTTKVYSPLTTQSSQQQIFNSLILKQTNTTQDFKNRPIFIEKTVIPY